MLFDRMIDICFEGEQKTESISGRKVESDLTK